MSSDISYKGELFWVSNQRLSTLVDCAIEVGADIADGPEAAAFVGRLREEEQSGVLFPGCNFDLDERFPTLAAKKFWARAFREVGQRIFLRRWGNHDIDSWQASAICDAELIARMLTEAVRSTEPSGNHVSGPNVDPKPLIEVPVVEQMPEWPPRQPKIVEIVDYMLTKLLRDQAGMLHGDFGNDGGRCHVRGWTSEAMGPDEVVATIENKSHFRMMLARFGHHYLADQLYGGYREVFLGQNRKLHHVAIYMANDQWRGYWLRAYARDC